MRPPGAWDNRSCGATCDNRIGAETPHKLCLCSNHTTEPPRFARHLPTLPTPTPSGRSKLTRSEIPAGKSSGNPNSPCGNDLEQQRAGIGINPATRRIATRAPTRLGKGKEQEHQNAKPPDPRAEAPAKPTIQAGRANFQVWLKLGPGRFRWETENQPKGAPSTPGIQAHGRSRRENSIVGQPTGLNQVPHKPKAVSRALVGGQMAARDIKASNGRIAQICSQNHRKHRIGKSAPASWPKNGCGSELRGSGIWPSSHHFSGTIPPPPRRSGANPWRGKNMAKMGCNKCNGR